LPLLGAPVLLLGVESRWYWQNMKRRSVERQAATRDVCALNDIDAPV
jgi:hypothetical protein